MRDFNINFIVHSPFPEYVNYIGGLMVCHSLAHDLAVLGESSFLSANSTKSKYSCNLIPWGSNIDYDPENTILIQGSGADHVFQHLIPESIKKIPNTVRWLMGDQGYTYSAEDKFYLYCDNFKPYPDQRVDGKFLSLDVEHDIFYDKGLKRSGGCFYTKGHNINKTYHKKDDLCLDNIYHLSDQERYYYLAKIFNEKEYFICYTHRSFTAVLAALCGCIVITIPYIDGVEVNFNEDDVKEWRKTLPTFRYGIGCGIKEWEYASSTIHQVKDNIKQIQKDSLIDIKKFVDDCYIWMKDKYNI